MSSPGHLEARAAAEQLQDASRQVLQLRAEVEEVCQRLREIARCAWAGPAADAWRDRLTELRSEGEGVGAGLDRLGNELKAAATRVRPA